jgi:Bacterial Ig-like domain (group 2)
MRRGLVALTVLATVVACDSNAPTRPDPAARVVTGLTVSGDGAFTAINQIHPLIATAQLENGSPLDVTGEAIWESSDPSVVAVSRRGEVTAVGLGTAKITASYQGKQSSLDVTVVPVDTPARMVGNYRLAFTAAAPCGTLPEWARHREYDAAIVQQASLRLTVELQPGEISEFDVAIHGTRVEVAFVSQLAYGSYGQAYPVFWDVIDGRTIFAVEGTAAGPLHNSRIVGVLSGDIRAVTLSSNGESTVACNREDHEFNLVRR